MAASEKRSQKVYLFKKDHDMIEELVRRRPNEETGGDLFGLWTTSDEPVLHIVTGQGREIQRALPNSLPTNDDSVTSKRRKLGAVLREKFHLGFIGKWQYKPTLVRPVSSEQNDMAIIRAVGQEHLRQGSNVKDFVFIMVDYDESSRQLQLSQYFLSQSSTVTKAESETLRGESVFGSDDDVKRILENAENGSNSYDVRSRKDTHGSTDEGKNEAPPTEPESTDVEMKDVSRYFDNSSRWPANPTTLPGMQADFACNHSNFKVYLFEEDKKMMEELVLRYQDVETGGDLFGLWTTDGDAVLHIVLGPGQNCKRTDVSFYQDIPYLQRNGEMLTQKYMLCHIGEWHSHHRLHLFRPSQGDSTTVIRNYPRGTCGFLLIIANIVSATKVELSPYLYTANSRHHFDRKGELVPLPHPNAFRIDPAIQRSMEEGMETKRDQRYTVTYQGSSTHQYSTRSKGMSNPNMNSSPSTGARADRQAKPRPNWRY